MEELAKLLGTTKEKLESLSDEMGEFTGKKEVPDQLLAKIKDEWSQSLTELGLNGSSSRKEVLAALAKRVELLEEEAKKVLGEPQMQDHAYIQKLFARAVAIAKPKKGFFLKEEKAKEFFRKESFQLNGKEFDLYGVLHIPETIELHHKELENAIQKAGAVIVEIGPDITALRSALEDADLNEEVKKDINEFFHFYNYISTLAGTQNKLVINADPSEGEGGEKWKPERRRRTAPESFQLLHEGLQFLAGE